MPGLTTGAFVTTGAVVTGVCVGKPGRKVTPLGGLGVLTPYVGRVKE